MSNVFVIGGLNGKELKELISVRYCASTGENRPSILGVLFYTQNGRLYSEALDGFRMSMVSIEYSHSNDVFFRVPASSLVSVYKALKAKSSVAILVDKSKNKVVFRVDGVDIVSDLVPLLSADSLNRLFTGEGKYKVGVEMQLLTIATVVYQMTFLLNDVITAIESEAIRRTNEAEIVF